MPTVATSLLDFILHLLRDPSAAAAFQANPQASLNAAGLGSVSAADVHAVLPVVLDYSSATQASSFDRSYAGATGGLHGGVGTAVTATPASEVHAAVGSSTTTPTSGGGTTGSTGGHYSGAVGSSSTPHAGGHAPSTAVAHLQDIINNYTYTSVDDRTTIIDHSINQDVYAAGDVNQSFDDHSATATGDGAVAGHVAGPVTTGSNNLVADHSAVGNTDNSTNTYGSFNDSGNDSHAVSNSGNGSGNDSHDTTSIADHSFNPNDSFDDLSDHSTTDSHATATANTTTNTTNTTNSTTNSTTNTATNSGNGSGNNNGNFSGNDASDHSVTDDHSTDLNAALSDSHDAYTDNSDNSVNTELHHPPVLVDSAVDDSGNHLHV